MTERRQRILAAARAIVAARGYEALTMRELAQKSRVTVPTLYNLIGEGGRAGRRRRGADGALPRRDRAARRRQPCRAPAGGDRCLHTRAARAPRLLPDAPPPALHGRGRGAGARARGPGA